MIICSQSLYLHYNYMLLHWYIIMLLCPWSLLILISPTYSFTHPIPLLSLMQGWIRSWQDREHKESDQVLCSCCCCHWTRQGKQIELLLICAYSWNWSFPTVKLVLFEVNSTRNLLMILVDCSSTISSSNISALPAYFAWLRNNTVVKVGVTTGCDIKTGMLPTPCCCVGVLCTTTQCCISKQHQSVNCLSLQKHVLLLHFSPSPGNCLWLSEAAAAQVQCKNTLIYSSNLSSSQQHSIQMLPSISLGILRLIPVCQTVMYVFRLN